LRFKTRRQWLWMVHLANPQLAVALYLLSLQPVARLRKTSLMMANRGTALTDLGTFFYSFRSVRRHSTRSCPTFPPR
jgi:hypothetical protein